MNRLVIDYTAGDGGYRMFLIGDTHGNIKHYRDLLVLVDAVRGTSLHVGDFGLGFGPDRDRWASAEQYSLQNNGHYFIRGNHDDPAVCRPLTNYLGEFGADSNRSLFWAGGAYSIDKDLRLQLMSRGNAPCWWEDEELSPSQMDEAFELYRQHKPRFVVTHDAPVSLYRDLGASSIKMNRTGTFLQDLLEHHVPEMWFFGHWHIPKEIKSRGCRFRCVGECELLDVPEIPDWYRN